MVIRAEPWNRTTPYELEVRHALFTLVPRIKGGEVEVSVPPTPCHRSFQLPMVRLLNHRGARVGGE